MSEYCVSEDVLTHAMFAVPALTYGAVRITCNQTEILAA